MWCGWVMKSWSGWEICLTEFYGSNENRSDGADTIEMTASDHVTANSRRRQSHRLQESHLQQRIWYDATKSIIIIFTNCSISTVNKLQTKINNKRAILGRFEAASRALAAVDTASEAIAIRWAQRPPARKDRQDGVPRGSLSWEMGRCEVVKGANAIKEIEYI